MPGSLKNAKEQGGLFGLAGCLRADTPAFGDLADFFEPQAVFARKADQADSKSPGIKYMIR